MRSTFRRTRRWDATSRPRRRGGLRSVRLVAVGLAAGLTGGLAGVALAVPVASAEPGPDAVTAGNVLLPAVHTDIATTLDVDGELRLLFHTDDGAYLDPATTIVEVPETTRNAIPAPSGGRDYKFMGPVGSDVWVLPEIQTDGLAWLGWSAESKHIPGDAYRGLLDLRLDGVAGIVEASDGGLDEQPAPGELVLSDGFTTRGYTPMFSTREGLPHAVQLDRGTHKHLNWAFTAPGTYCVGFAIGGELADGTYSERSAVMTFVVGQPSGLDPTEVTTCAQAGLFPDRQPSHDPTQPPVGQAKVFHPRPQSGGTPGTNEYAALRPILTDDQQLDVSLVEGTQVDAGVRHDPDNAVFVVDRSSKKYADDPADNYYAFGAGQGQGFYGKTQLQFDTTRLDDLEDDALTWTLSRVRGPGHASLLALTGGAARSPVLSNRSGESTDTWITRTGRGGALDARLYGAGIYCLDLTWSATPTGAVATTVSKTLRFAVDVTHPENATDEDCGKTAAEYDAPTPALTSISAAPVTQVYGQPRQLLITVAPQATGAVTVTAGSNTVTAPLIVGRAKVMLPAKALAPGQHTVSISYPGADRAFMPATGTATVTVTKATPVVKVKPTRATVKRGQTVALKVTVTAPGAHPSGKATVKVAGKTRTVKLNKHGKATVKVQVGRRATPGRKNVRVTYHGDAYVARAKAKPTKIKVIR